MDFSDKDIQKIKDILEKEHGREFTWEEATKAMWSLQRFVEIASDIASEECRMQEMLKKHPKGFHFDQIGSCCKLCDKPTSNENSWFDKNGLKCMTCQKAIDSKIIPISVVKNKESWYSKYDLDFYFNIGNSDLKKILKRGLLKDRIIFSDGKKVHLQLFLIQDNKSVLPPKKLLESRIVKIIKDGEEYYTQEFWYEFIDSNHLKRLMKYKIADCLKETLAKPIQRGRFSYKNINPLFNPKIFK